jgi:hypothetical protein
MLTFLEVFLCLVKIICCFFENYVNFSKFDLGAMHQMLFVPAEFGL